jgi:hypothetical protein
MPEIEIYFSLYPKRQLNNTYANNLGNNLCLHTITTLSIELITRGSELLRYDIAQVHQIIEALLQSLESSSSS